MEFLPIELFRQNLSEIKTLIGDLVGIESPSTDPAAVNRLGERICADLQKFGGEINLFPGVNSGN